MLTEQQMAKLEAERYRATKYEVVIQRTGGEKQLLVYTANKSVQSLRSIIHARGEAILRAYDLPSSAAMTYNGLAATPRFLIGGDVEIYVSGRTKREAITEGELPFYLPLSPTP